jgi:hypothetical protein
MCLAPLPERAEDRAECSSLFGEQILGARRVGGVKPALDHAAFLELLEPSGQNAGRESRERIAEILKAPGAIQQEIAEDEDRPAIADEVEGAGDGTVESV